MKTPQRFLRASLLLWLLALAPHPAVAASEVDSDPSAGSSDPRLSAKQSARSGAATEQLIERPDRKRTEDPLEIQLFGRPLSLEGRYSLQTRVETDFLRVFDFSNEADERARGNMPDDDRWRVDQNLEVDLLYPFTEQISAYASGQVKFESLLETDVERKGSRLIWERKEFWVYAGNLLDTPFSAQVGQQNFSDEREWWWDEDLDAARLHFDLEKVHLEAGVSQRLFPVESNEHGIDPEEEEVLRFLFSGTWEWRKKHELGVYVMHQNDHSGSFPIGLCIRDFGDPFVTELFVRGCIDTDEEDESDANVTTFGLSANGRWVFGDFVQLGYWLDGALAEGRESFIDFDGSGFNRFVDTINRHEVSGVGFDVGMTWQLEVLGRPRLTVGHAFGSGRKHNDEKERDQGFRQTGLEDNNGDFGGVASFRYYGELLDPELSNLEILTIGFGFRFLEESSLDVVYHRYRQHQPTDFLRSADIKRDPTGMSRDLGEEWDVILGIEEWGPVEIKAVGAVFKAGRAFRPSSGERSYLGLVRARVNF